MNSLSDLKSEAEQQDAEILAAQKAAEEIEDFEEEAEQNELQEGEESAPGADKEPPEWAKTDEQLVPVSKHIEMKHKLKARANEAQAAASAVAQENERLRQELERLRAGAQAPEQSDLKMPTLAECDYDEEIFAQRNAAYVNSLIEKKLSGHVSKTQAQQQAEAQQHALNGEVEKHYERASKLVAEGIVTPENFQAAELVVRNRIASALPNYDADNVVDTLIASLGNGSEKVIYHLGVNPAALAELESSLKANPSGLRAATYLGELKTRFETASKIKPSNSLKPDRTLKGDASTGRQNYLKNYRAAESNNDPSLMVRLKREAKAAGIDTSKW